MKAHTSFRIALIPQKGFYLGQRMNFFGFSFFVSLGSGIELDSECSDYIIIDGLWIYRNLIVRLRYNSIKIYTY